MICGALSDQEISSPEDHGRCLLRLTLHGDKAHGWSLRSLADCLRISHIVLLSLDKGLHIGGRDQADFVAQFAKSPRPW